ncbi:MAG: ATP-binding protein [Gemmatimonadota bacterium]|jgi:signal transduction histidine kinase
MRLRQRLILIFLGLGVVPILVAGWMAHRRNLSAVRELVASQARERADRLAGEIETLYEPRRSELLYFAENTETLRLLRGATHGPDPRTHLREAWETLGESLQGLEIVSEDGAGLFRMGQPVFGLAEDSPESIRYPRALGDVWVAETIRDPVSDQALGEIRITLAPGGVFPSLSESSGFGRFGQVMVVDDESGRILAHSARQAVGLPLAAALEGMEPLGATSPQLESGMVVQFTRRDSVYLGAYADIARSPWSVLSIASLDEFSSGVASTGRMTLAFVVLMAALALGVGTVAMGRALRRLDAVAAAAGKIAEGDFSPALPKEGGDEVGTLVRAFRFMAGEVQEMLTRVEESRQLAAVGEFASQVAHEIRNPLTAIRVNLQALRRDLRDTPLAEDHGRPLDLTIAEVDRLDRVTRGVLTLAQSPMKNPKPLSLHGELDAALAILRPDLEGMNVAAQARLDAESDLVHGNGPALRGAILNLIRNAAEAMPEGGTVRLRTKVADGGPQARVLLHIQDEGPGVDARVRESLFDPFVTTKEEGSGLGLAVALRTVEAHGGELRLSDDSPADTGPASHGAPLSEPAGGAASHSAPAGAHFVMDLPLMGPEKASRHMVPGLADSEHPTGDEE